VRRGCPVVLAVAGDGPLRRRLRADATGLPVQFLGHLDDPALVAALLASADVVVAPGPVETFGLAALEALACGTAVVGTSTSAIGEVLGGAGELADPNDVAFADAIERVLARPVSVRRLAARARACEFDWARTVARFLAVHQLPTRVAP
jgi:alpha-1,6-mannosyltransferase